MKKTLLAGLIAAQGLLFAQIVPTNGLIGRWEFTNGSANDGSTSGNHGTKIGTSLTTDRCGNANNALSFNGTSDYIQLLQAGPTGSSSRSLAFWMRSTNTSTSVRSAFDYGYSNSAGGAFQICHNYNCQGIGLDVSNQAFIKNNGSCNLNDGQWHHIALVYNSSWGTTYTNVAYYIDGILQTPFACNISGLNATMNTIATNSLNAIKIGCGADQAGNKIRFFLGDIDDMYLYNRDLSYSEILGLMTRNCGITQNPCFCNSTNLFTAPFVQGATYTWGLPSTWTGSSNGNIIGVTAPNNWSGPYTITTTITTNCGLQLYSLTSNTYCNSNGGTINVAAGASNNGTYCANGGAPITLTAGISYTGSVSYLWVPGNQTGPSINVSPGSNTIYQVIVTPNAPDFCVSTASVNVIVYEDCCPQAGNGYPTLTGNISSTTYNAGGYFITGNVMLTGNTNFVNSEFLIAPNAKIIIPSGTNLNLDGSHLYACGTNMWDGIEVQDNGIISTPNSGGAGGTNSSLIEDAKIAIDLNNHSTLNSVPAIDIENVTFNKNHIGINISNTAPNLTTFPLRILGCVFTSRNLPFTSTTWPSADITDLRSTNAVLLAGLASPYLMNNYSPATIKAPYLGQNSLIGIQIENIYNLPGLAPTAGIDIGVSYQGAAAFGTNDDFNLFDNLGAGIDVTDASLTTMNNVFQNMIYNFNIQGMSGIGIHQNIQQTAMPPLFGMNALLDLRPVGIGNQSTAFGNRFWNCYYGVKTDDVYDVDIEYGIYRSSQTYPILNLAPGNHGIYLKSCRFDYNIRFSEFNNLNYGINMRNSPGNFDVNNSGPIMNQIYASNIIVEQNYFGAHVTSNTPLNNNEYFGDAIHLIGPNQPQYMLAGSVGASITSNKIDRAFRGVSLNSMFDYPVNIQGNLIYLVDETMPPFNRQYGVEALDNQGNLVITENTVSTAVGNNNTLMSLIYNKDNQGTNVNLGTGSPMVNCNVVSFGYNGFEFEGNNSNCDWLGNSMTGNTHGLLLSNSAIIGQQGTPAMPSGNTWNGPWNGPGWSTWVNNSVASLSTLYVWSQNGIHIPQMNGASFGSTAYAIGTTVISTKRNPFACPATNYPPLPNLRSASTTGISNSENNSEITNVRVYPNPSAGHVIVDGLTDNDVVMINVTDINGRNILSQKTLVKNSTVDLEIPTEQSVYFIEIITRDNISIHKKLIINK